MTTFDELPKPNEKALKRSLALSAFLSDLSQHHYHRLSFAQFMNAALYHPIWGYYEQPEFAIGERGDFITAPHLSPLFAQCLAKQCLPIFDHLGESSVIEFGAGTGQLAHDLLCALNAQNALPQRYVIVEKSAQLRNQQRLFLTQNCPFFSQITWLPQMPENFVGVILANEVLDALPVHCFQFEGPQLMERGIRVEKQQCHWQTYPADALLVQQINELQQTITFPHAYRSEINLDLPLFLTPIIKQLKKGVILFLDYGYSAREYYHPERREGTLTCFYRHHQHTHALAYPGLHDITAHVNFSSVIEVAHQAGCSLLGYTSQAAFLLALDLLHFGELSEKKMTAPQQMAMHHAIKKLTFPTEMGERIKVMALGKEVDLKLAGFTLQDRRHEL